jgi:ABC-type polysaccharide/polyol phosphate transport system ATPase subunit
LLPSNAVTVEHVFKRFRKGELSTSLRDAVPALIRKLRPRDHSTVEDRRTFWALQDVSFEVPRGEAFGIIGRNGAGKSTVMKLLSRIMNPTTGTVEVSGRVSALIEIGAAFHPDLTGRENIFLYGVVLGMTRREIAARFDEIVAFSGLEEFIDTPVKRYSSGMYARLGFSLASHVRPEILIVDEVLSVGDYVFQQKCVERMHEVVRGGATVLLVSHDLKTVTDFCTRCLLLDKGRVISVGSPHEVIKGYLERFQSQKTMPTGDQAVAITKVVMRDANGEALRFEAGQKAWIDIEITARKSCRKLAVAVFFKDDRHYHLFDTSTERLGHGNVSLEEGDVFSCTFQLTLNFGSGTFHPAVSIYRYDIQEEYDSWPSAGTIHVRSALDVRGAVNLFPMVVRQEIHARSPRTDGPEAALSYPLLTGSSRQ